MDGQLLGLSVYSTTNRVRRPSATIQRGGVPYSDQLIRGLLHVSLADGRGDPRRPEERNRHVVETALGIIHESERQTIQHLQNSNSRLFWVQINPWFLYAILPGIGAYIIGPFVEGFFNRMGSHAADWLVDQISA
ncbi:MAG: hypothetical protein OXK81_14630 [Chloroflexota bacterium]|nr:hypothetical protein [Chloroflexota bacterium]